MENTIAEGFEQKNDKTEARKTIGNGSHPFSVIEPCGVFTLRQDEGMKSRGEGGLKCVTWSGVPTEVIMLVHLSAALQTVRGTPPTGEDLIQARSLLAEITGRIDFTPDEYLAVAQRVVGADPSGDRTQTLPRDVLVDILRETLERSRAGEKIRILASDKSGVPLRAWLPPDLIEEVKDFCHKRCTRTALFVTAATEYFSRRGITLDER